MLKTVSKFLGPAPFFSAYLGTNQTLTSGVTTKLALDTEEFDTASCYNTTTYRFTPNVAGYYQVNAAMTYGASASATQGLIYIYKNGGQFKTGSFLSGSSSAVTASALIYMNGTTDYIELFGYVVAATPVANSGAKNTFFQAALLQPA